MHSLPTIENILQKDVSMLTYEQNKFQGTDQIIGGLVDMPFQKVVHTIFSVDAQPSGVDGALLVSVQGELHVSYILLLIA